MTTLTPAPELKPPPADRRKRRVIGMLIWAVVFAIGTAFIGVPTSDPLIAFGWLWLATIAWNSDRPWRQHLLFLRDWLPIALLLVVYNISRGYADDLFAPHVTEMIHADQAMFGGNVPTVWLQQHLYHPRQVQWWEVAVSLVYVSHFLTVPTVAVILWLRSRQQWGRYMRRWFFLSVAGLITYFLYPAAPPWWASQFGYLPDHVVRISTAGWNAIGLHGAGNTLNALQVEASNPVAAMPSLHTAYAMMAVAFFLPVVAKRWWPLLLAYPLAMTFTLVYSGEHYVIDVLVGWAYVAATFLLVGWAERWWAARTAATPAAESPSPTDTGLPHPTSAAAGGASAGVTPAGPSASATPPGSSSASASSGSATLSSSSSAGATPAGPSAPGSSSGRSSSAAGASTVGSSSEPASSSSGPSSSGAGGDSRRGDGETDSKESL